MIVTEADAVWTKVARLQDLDEQYPSRVVVNDTELVLCRKAAEVFALSNLCSHAYAFLSDGYIEGDELFCPLHDGSFDLRSGEARQAPCDESIATFPVKIEDGEVFVQTKRIG